MSPAQQERNKRTFFHNARDPALTGRRRMGSQACPAATRAHSAIPSPARWSSWCDHSPGTSAHFASAATTAPPAPIHSAIPKHWPNVRDSDQRGGWMSPPPKGRQTASDCAGSSVAPETRQATDHRYEINIKRVSQQARGPKAAGQTTRDLIAGPGDTSTRRSSRWSNHSHVGPEMANISTSK